MKKIYFIFSLIALAFATRSDAQCAVTITGITPNGLSVSATSQGTGAVAGVYYWLWDGSSNTSGQNATHNFSTAGTHTICVIYADATNPTCADSACTIINLTATGVNTLDVVRSNFKCSPNPMNDNALINYALATSATVNVRAYDVLGNQVAILENGMVSAGQHSLNWNTTDLPTGVYFVRIQTGDVTSTIKVVKQ